MMIRPFNTYILILLCVNIFFQEEFIYLFLIINMSVNCLPSISITVMHVLFTMIETFLRPEKWHVNHVPEKWHVLYNTSGIKHFIKILLVCIKENYLAKT